jgi:hypothetical protein
MASIRVGVGGFASRDKQEGQDKPPSYEVLESVEKGDGSDDHRLAHLSPYSHLFAMLLH